MIIGAPHADLKKVNHTDIGKILQQFFKKDTKILPSPSKTGISYLNAKNVIALTEIIGFMMTRVE